MGGGVSVGSCGGMRAQGGLVMTDRERITRLEIENHQARKVLADLRHVVAALERYAPRRHAVRTMRRRLVGRTRAA